MKTSARTTLPVNPREGQHPLHEIKRNMLSRCSVYHAAIIAPLVICFNCWLLYFEPSFVFVTEKHEMVTQLVMVVMSSLAGIVWVAMAARVGDIYFYECYVEIRRILPFMKRKVIYYDKMHVHITKKEGLVSLNNYRTPPKFLESPYTWLKANFSDVIGFSIVGNTEVLEFVKTKAQSVKHL